MHVLETKIKATIGSEGDMIGWPDEEETVGPVALKVKESFLRFIPYVMPTEKTTVFLYRPALEHGDYGIHNVLTIQRKKVDWETACIVPALLSDPVMAVTVDLTANEKGEPCATRVPENPFPTEEEKYRKWARHYIQVR